MEILMKKTGINGEGIGYINKKPGFVPQALQGELCEVEVVEEKEVKSNSKKEKETNKDSDKE